MSTITINLGKAKWYVSKPDFSVAQAEELTGKRQALMKARIVLSLPHIAPKIRVAAHLSALANLVMGVIIVGTVVNA